MADERPDWRRQLQAELDAGRDVRLPFVKIELSERETAAQVPELQLIPAAALPPEQSGSRGEPSAGRSRS